MKIIINQTLKYYDLFSHADHPFKFIKRKRNDKYHIDMWMITVSLNNCWWQFYQYATSSLDAKRTSKLIRQEWLSKTLMKKDFKKFHFVPSQFSAFSIWVNLIYFFIFEVSVIRVLDKKLNLLRFFTIIYQYFDTFSCKQMDINDNWNQISVWTIMSLLCQEWNNGHTCYESQN